MKINKKFLSIILLGTAFIMLGIPNKSNAALQSNGGTPTVKNLETWLLQIRKMQELGGTLGRTDTINTEDLTSEATDLDIHMEKNTEYGAMAILSASAYGNPNKINDGETTTGNSTGVVIKINNEWVAAGNLSFSARYTNANLRYKNMYTTTYVPKSGDAISETKGWHSSTSSLWLSSGSTEAANRYVGLLRANGGSIFSYYGKGNPSTGFGASGTYYTLNYCSRAAIVVGADL